MMDEATIEILNECLRQVEALKPPAQANRIIILALERNLLRLRLLVFRAQTNRSSTVDRTPDRAAITEEVYDFIRKHDQVESSEIFQLFTKKTNRRNLQRYLGYLVAEKRVSRRFIGKSRVVYAVTS